MMKKKILSLGLAALFLFLTQVKSVGASTLIYDDFNDGAFGTNLGGSAGAMSPGGAYDPTITFTSGANAYEGAYALSIQYNFPSGQWCGYWSFFYADENGYDVSGYDTLEMWVKGAAGSEKFKVELKDTANILSAVRITTIEGFSGGLTTGWLKLSIALTRFSGVDLTNLKQINIVFDEAPLSGTVFIDSMAFTTSGPSNQPPNASFTYSPGSPSIDNVIQFTDQSTDSDGTITSWSWNFGDGGISTIQNPTHQYSAAGTYAVALTVTDNGGATDNVSQNITVTGGNSPPTANFTYSPSSPTTADSIQFTDTSTDIDGTIASWSWNFGDGRTSTIQNPTHQYSSADTYTVTLTVTDNGGLTNTKSENISVTSGANGGTELVYDDFNDGEHDTNIGGAAGAMSPDGLYDPLANFTSSTDAYEGAHALSLEYNFPPGQWCGYWSFFRPDENSYDVSGYDELRMRVKGALGGEQFKIELKSSAQEISYKYMIVSGTGWSEIVVPLSGFGPTGWPGYAPAELTRLIQVNIVFDRAPRQGTVYIDLIRFVVGEPTPQTPIADFTYAPSTPKIGDVMTFDASASTDPDGTIVSYSWDFGDGGTDTGVTVSHTYHSEENYPVLLIVTDNSGLTDTKSVLITTSSEIPPGPGDNETPGGGEPLNTALITGTATLIVLGVITALILIKGRKYPETEWGWRSEPPSGE